MGRVDGRRVRSEVPLYHLMPQFMPRRYDAMNMTTVDIPVEPMRRYMNAKRKEGIHVSHMALIMTAYAHLVGEYPSINRFIANKRIYEHKDISVSLAVLRPGDSGNDDTIAKLYFTPEDTVFDVQRKIDEYVETNAVAAEEADTSFDKAMAVLVRFGPLLDIIGAIIRFADRHGLLPQSLVDASPFHASLLITNLASIRTNHIFHHIYDFGTTSASMAIGNMRYIAKPGRDGSVQLVRTMPLGIVVDDRIASGFYIAQAFMRFKEMLGDPTVLEKPGEYKNAFSDQRR